MRVLLERQNRLSMPVNATKCTKIDESQASQQVISLSPGWVSIGEAWMKQAEIDGSLGKFLRPSMLPGKSPVAPWLRDGFSA